MTGAISERFLHSRSSTAHCLLCEEDSRCEVVAQPQDLGDLVVPVQVLRVNLEQVPTGEWSARRMEYVQRLVNKLAELAEALVHRSYV